MFKSVKKSITKKKNVANTKLNSIAARTRSQANKTILPQNPPAGSKGVCKRIWRSKESCVDEEMDIDTASQDNADELNDEAELPNSPAHQINSTDANEDNGIEILRKNLRDECNIEEYKILRNFREIGSGTDNDSKKRPNSDNVFEQSDRGRRPKSQRGLFNLPKEREKKVEKWLKEEAFPDSFPNFSNNSNVEKNDRIKVEGNDEAVPPGSVDWPYDPHSYDIEDLISDVYAATLRDGNTHENAQPTLRRYSTIPDLPKLELLSLDNPVQELQQPLEPTVEELQQPLEPPVQELQQPLELPVQELQQPLEPPLQELQQPLEPPVRELLQPLEPPLQELPQPLEPPVLELQQPLEPPVPELQQPLEPPVQELPEPVEPSLQQLQQLQLTKHPVVFLTRLEDLVQGFKALKPPGVEIHDASISKSPGPPELYIATLDPIRATPDLEMPDLEMEIVDNPVPIQEIETLATPVSAPDMVILDTTAPVLEMETLDTPAPVLEMETLDAPEPPLEMETLDAPVPDVEMKILDAAVLPVPDYEDMESSEEKTPLIELPETPKVEIPEYECPLEEATVSKLENSLEQLSVSKVPPIHIPMLKLSIEDINDSSKSSHIVDEIKEDVKEEVNTTGNEAEDGGVHSNPSAMQMNEESPEIDVGVTDGNNNAADEPDPAFVQLMSMTMSPNESLSRHYAKASPLVKNAIREKFNSAFNNMDKNPDVYDREMLRLLQLYPLELVPEEIVEYYLGPIGH